MPLARQMLLFFSEKSVAAMRQLQTAFFFS